MYNKMTKLELDAFVRLETDKAVEYVKSKYPSKIQTIIDKHYINYTTRERAFLVRKALDFVGVKYDTSEVRSMTSHIQWQRVISHLIFCDKCNRCYY